MAFRVRNIKSNNNLNVNKDIDLKEFVYELDNMANCEKYIPKETARLAKISNNINKKLDNKLDTIVDKKTIDKETIVYDKTLSKWIIIKDSELYKYQLN